MYWPNKNWYLAHFPLFKKKTLINLNLKRTKILRGLNFLARPLLIEPLACRYQTKKVLKGSDIDFVKTYLYSRSDSNRRQIYYLVDQPITKSNPEKYFLTDRSSEPPSGPLWWFFRGGGVVMIKAHFWHNYKVSYECRLWRAIFFLLENLYDGTWWENIEF